MTSYKRNNFIVIVKSYDISRIQDYYSSSKNIPAALASRSTYSAICYGVAERNLRSMQVYFLIYFISCFVWKILTI